MDGPRFDDFTKALAVSGTRRRLIGGIVAGFLGLAGRDRADARTCSSIDLICREHANCCSGLCGPKDRTGRQRCACQSGADCPVAGSTCQTGVCVPPAATTKPPATTTKAPTSTTSTTTSTSTSTTSSPTSTTTSTTTSAGTTSTTTTSCNCPPASGVCAYATCVSNVCGTALREAGYAPPALQSPGDCQKIVCTGTNATSVTSADDVTDIPTSNSACLINPSCDTSGGPATPYFDPAPTGTDCSGDGGGGRVCGDTNNPLIAGTCVECNSNADCTASTCNTTAGVCEAG